MARSFAANPPRILMYPGNQIGGGYYRIFCPATLLRQHGYAQTIATPQFFQDQALEALQPHVIVLQHQMGNPDKVKQLRKAVKGVHIVYEIDDLFWGVPDRSPHKPTLPPDIKDRIKNYAKVCDAITVTTEPLAAEMQKLTGNKNVRVVPNQIPERLLNAALAARRSAKPNRDKPRVGWAGGIGHIPDLDLIRDVMAIVGDRVQWVFFGLVPEGVDPATVELHRDVHFEQYHAALGNMALDLALAPLIDHPFNHCKSDLKVLEYGAAGFPVVASDIGTYAKCPVDVLPNDPQAWADYVLEFIARPQAKQDEAGQKLHEWVIRNRMMEGHLLEWEQAFLPRNSEPFNPGSAPIEELLQAKGFWQINQQAIGYIRPGTPVNQDQLDRLLERLRHNASVSALTNDGQYPAYGQFSQLSQQTSAQIDQAAAAVDGSAAVVPFPTGPVVVMNRMALSRFGIPNLQESGGDAELAIMDWAARVQEGGMKHVLTPNVFLHTDKPIIREPAVYERATARISQWSPSFTQRLQEFNAENPFVAARQDIELCYHRLFYHSPTVRPDYAGWARIHGTIGKLDKAAMEAEIEKWENPPRISIILPTYNSNPDHLREAIKSVTDQAYPNWQLCIHDDGSLYVNDLNKVEDRDPRITFTRSTENRHICHSSNEALKQANGDWVIFLDHDDVLAPHALFCLAKEIMAHPDAQFIYSDSDKLGMDGNRTQPYFTSDFNYELLLAQNYVTHIACYRLEQVKKIGGVREGLEGSQDWDLVLRYLESTCGFPFDRSLIRHIPHVLYHWRQHEQSVSANINAKPYAILAGRRAVMEHLQRTGQNAFVGQHPMLPFHQIRFLVTEPHPKVSIVIPTKNNADKLQACIGSVLAKTAYQNYEILIVDNGSTDKRAVQFLNQVQQDKRIRVIRHPGPFNYAEINNKAAEQATGEFLLLLNDDTEVVEPAWLLDMVGLASREGVGAVGARLIYSDQTVQQAGTIVNFDAPAGQKALHAWRKMPTHFSGQAGRALLTGEWLAVTGACLLIQKDLYLRFRMDEDSFPIDFNDVDLCLRLFRAGYRNLVSSTSTVIHHEGASKKATGYKAKQMLEAESRLVFKHGGLRDPYLNPNLAYTPHFDALAFPGAKKPWETPDRPNLLIVNGTVEDAFQAWDEGFLPYCGTLQGHHLTLGYPALANVTPLDLRGPVDDLLILMGKLDIPQIRFCGIGDGTIAAVGYMTALKEAGWPVEFKPNGAHNTGAHAHLDDAVWQHVWNRFMTAWTPTEEAT